MTTKTSLTRILLAVGMMVAAQADVPEAVRKALDKLKAADNYSWTTETERVGTQRRGGSPVIGKANKEGWAHISQEIGANKVEVVRKGKEAAMKTEDGWKKADELPQPQLGGRGEGGGQSGGGGRGGMGAWMGRRLLTQSVPAEQLSDLAKDATDWSTTDAVHTAKLSGDALQGMVMGGAGRGGAGARGGQRGGGGGAAAAAAAPETTGKLKLWVKDGLITQAEVHVESKFTLPNGDTRDFHSISKTEIKGVESTQLSIPEDAKKKLGS